MHGAICGVALPFCTDPIFLGIDVDHGSCKPVRRVPPEIFMTKRMLIDAVHPEETRVVVLNNNQIDEFDFESSSKAPCAAIYIWQK